MNIDKKYIELFNEYAGRIKDEKLSEVSKCSMSIKVSDVLFAYVMNVNGTKPIIESDIIIEGMISVSENKEAELYRQLYIMKVDARAVIHAFPDNACTVGNAKVIIPAMLDDMAQIIGPDARYSENDNTAILKVLKKRNACMITGNGVLTYGRSLDEAYVGCLVLEKSAKCLIDTTVLGGYTKIKFVETLLMHYIYQKKYSKLNQLNKQKELDGNSEQKAVAKPTFSDTEMNLRQQVKDAGVRLLNSNLVQGTWGNISIRLDDKHMLITPTALDYLSLTPEDMVVVNLDTMEYSGLHKPSGERDIHAELLRTRKDINVVMHSHPTECSAFAAARVDMAVISDEMQKYVKGDAKVSDYGLPSTKKLAKMTVAAMEGRNACFMANHGMLSVGATIDEAFETCRVMEESARATIDQMTLKLSNAKTPSDRRKEIFLRKCSKA